MSADRIGEQCPKCEAQALREYYWIRLVKGSKSMPVDLVADYSAECNDCGWHVNFPEMTLWRIVL